jgi:ornithine carbamoyltransferase
VRVASPRGYELPDRVIAQARGIAADGGAVERCVDPRDAVRGADAVYTDVWASMGEEGEAEDRKVIFAPYQVNRALMALAAPDAVFMHCLPAHRGEEVTEEVIDGPQSVVFDEAENRLHAQKGVLAWALGALR